MNAFVTLHRRIERTRRWLQPISNQSQSTPIEELDEDALDIESIEESLSNFGIQSLGEQTFTDGEESLRGSEHDSAQSEVSAAAFLDGRELCEWLLNRFTFGSSYMSDGSLDPIEDAKHLSNARKAANNYELCGRGFDNTFRDLRSGSKVRKRHRKEQEKYYYWKGVQRGWLGEKVHDICELDSGGCTCLRRPDPVQDSKTVVVTKKLMYEKAKWYPRPPTYHRSTQKSYLRAWHSRIERAKEEGKHKQDFENDSLIDFDDYGCCNDHHVGDTFVAYLNDEHDWRQQENWCHICDVPWGRCAGVGGSVRTEVDDIESLTFETSADGKSWTLSWRPRMWPGDNRAPAVLPYTKQDWIPDGYVGLYTDEDAVGSWWG